MLFYLMLMPATLRGENGFLIEIGIAAIFLGAFLILFTRRLASASHFVPERSNSSRRGSPR